MDLKKAIKAAKKGDAVAQRYLYEQYKIPLFTLCMSYSRDRSEAEDILHEGFLKIFKDLHQFKGEGNIDGWMRKVMVNAALQYLRKWKKEWHHSETKDYQGKTQDTLTIFDKLGVEELLKLVQQLPKGYRIVFNLHVVEGYSHKEIAELLGVSENTSKSQLFKAKAALRKQLEKQLLA